MGPLCVSAQTPCVLQTGRQAEARQGPRGCPGGHWRGWGIFWVTAHPKVSIPGPFLDQAKEGTCQMRLRS